MKTKPELIRWLKTGNLLFAGFTEDQLGKLANGSRVGSFEANEAIDHLS